jgi:hypothetical protein
VIENEGKTTFGDFLFILIEKIFLLPRREFRKTKRKLF